MVDQTIVSSESEHEGEYALSPGRRWFIRFAILAVLSGIVFVMVEMTLRIVGVSYPRTIQVDPNRGASRIPGVKWLYTDEGRGYVEINQAGFRDSERPYEKPFGTVRIAVLGDSMVDAIQVSKKDRFTEVMERDLNDRGCFEGSNIEVFNFGMSGYGTAQELMVLRHHVWQFNPDLVILAFMTGNDVRNNSRTLQNDPTRPYFLLDDGKLTLDDSFKRKPGYAKPWWKRAAYSVMNYSRLAQFAYKAKENYQNRLAKAQARAQFTGIPVDVGLDDEIYKPPERPAWKEAWDVTEALLTFVNQEVKARGIEFLVVTTTNSIQDHPDLTEREMFKKRLGVDTLFYPEERVKSIGVRVGFSVLLLAPQMREYAEKNNAYLHGFENTQMGFGHWNEGGHRAAGKIISRRVCPVQ